MSLELDSVDDEDAFVLSFVSLALVKAEVGFVLVFECVGGWSVVDTDPLEDVVAEDASDVVSFPFSITGVKLMVVFVRSGDCWLMDCDLLVLIAEDVSDILSVSLVLPPVFTGEVGLKVMLKRLEGCSMVTCTSELLEEAEVKSSTVLPGDVSISPVGLAEVSVLSLSDAVEAKTLSLEAELR